MTDGCGGIETDVSCEEALVILEPFFIAARELFVAYEMSRSGSSRMRRVRLECTPELHDTPRHFAGTTEDGRVIMLAPQLVDLPESTVVGIMAHEFGHAMDFAYPGQWILIDGVLQHRDLVTPNDKRAARMAVAVSRQWRDRDDDAVERTADAIAEEVTGHVIGYAGPCLLQRFDEGVVPRPEGLR